MTNRKHPPRGKWADKKRRATIDHEPYDFDYLASVEDEWCDRGLIA